MSLLKPVFTTFTLLIVLTLFSHAALAQSTEALLKEDLADITSFMQQYKSWLSQTKASGYGELGFTYSTVALDKTVQDCQRLYQQKNIPQATNCLANWDDAFSKFDASITKTLLTLDKNYLSNTLTKSFITDIEAWIKDNETADYTYGDKKDAWEKLKQRVLTINNAWASNPSFYQEQLNIWYQYYDTWANDVSISLDNQYQEMLKQSEKSSEQNLTPFQDAEESLKKSNE